MGGTILIIEDDPIAREGYRAILEREGFGVALTANGSKALTYLSTHPPPCLIVLDMMMPAIDGWKFLSMYRQTPAWAKIPVIVTTSIGIASAEWAESLGAVVLLKKPFDPSELLQPIKQLCSPS